MANSAVLIRPTPTVIMPVSFRILAAFGILNPFGTSIGGTSNMLAAVMMFPLEISNTSTPCSLAILQKRIVSSIVMPPSNISS
ncbi:hypothetical protein EVA_14679 [gut metagenome]|uniref:Uncharacterized protein n=1 Tax=gut metagenome TaxID=749906 RepID=J9GCU5_9ZZZZ